MAAHNGSPEKADKTFLYSGLVVAAFGLFFWFTLDTSWIGITLAVIGALLVVMALVRDGDSSDDR